MIAAGSLRYTRFSITNYLPADECGEFCHLLPETYGNLRKRKPVTTHVGKQVCEIKIAYLPIEIIPYFIYFSNSQVFILQS